MKLMYMFIKARRDSHFSFTIVELRKQVIGLQNQRAFCLNDEKRVMGSKVKANCPHVGLGPMGERPLCGSSSGILAHTYVNFRENHGKF